ncbi:transposase [Escherichia sp. HH41S]|nr:transposase [Escherichia sp. HH41S]
MPVHDTIARVVSCISPAKFHECFINWMRDCHSSNDKYVIAIDGKALPHSYDKSGRRRAGFRSLTPTLPGPKHNTHSPQPKLIRIPPCRKLFSIFP